MCPMTRTYLLWLLAEEEALVELGLAEAAADDCDGTVVCGAVVLPPSFEQLAFSRHVLREGLKTQPGENWTPQLRETIPDLVRSHFCRSRKILSAVANQCPMRNHWLPGAW